MDKNLQQLSELFLKFPGIGQRQATRFAYFVLTQSEGYVKTLADTLVSVRKQAHTCSRCFRVYEGVPGMCAVCKDDHRDRSVLLVVEKSHDVDSFNKTTYNGLFFVLGGLIPIVQKNMIATTNLAQLIKRIEEESQKQYEVILAFPLTPNGEHTDAVIRENLALFPIDISSLGRGLSSGAELEYADAASLNASLKKRE